MYCYPINAPQTLVLLEPLLSQSYGEAIILKDETDYFEATNPPHWYYALDANGTALGFVRHFPIGEKAMVQLECFAVDQATWSALLKHVVQQTSTDASFDFALRYCLTEWAMESAAVLETLGFNPQTTYLQLDYTPTQTLALSPQVRLAQNTPTELAQIQQVFAQTLGSISAKRLPQQIEEAQLTIVLNEAQQVVGCCLSSAHETTRELIQLAVLPQEQGKGYGRLLLEQTMQLHRATYPEMTFWLRVRADNIPALGLYQRVGFAQTASETWWVHPAKQ